MTDERPQFGFRATGGNRDRRLLASLAGDALGAILLEPGAVNDKAGERLRQPRHQVFPRRGRKIVAGQERVADRRNIAEPFDHAINRQRRDLGGVIFRRCILILLRFLPLQPGYPQAYPLADKNAPAATPGRLWGLLNWCTGPPLS